MRNLILAITSFFATVLILSGVAMADINTPLDPNHTTSATSPDPMRSASEEGGINHNENGVANAGNKCPDGTCFKNTVGGQNTAANGRMLPATKCVEGSTGSCGDSKSAGSASPGSGSKTNGGSQ
jgi:hypothetical protein